MANHNPSLIGRCGLYCGACNIYRVYTDKKLDRQKKMAEFFKCKPEQVRCQGCQNLTSGDWCNDCKILQCLDKSKFQYCHECGKIETCDTYQELNRRYDEMPYKNLQRLKEIGETKWLEEKIKRWTCLGCGAPIEYDQDKCTKCNFDLTIIQD